MWIRCTLVSMVHMMFFLLTQGTHDRLKSLTIHQQLWSILLLCKILCHYKSLTPLKSMPQTSYQGSIQKFSKGGKNGKVRARVARKIFLPPLSPKDSLHLSLDLLIFCLWLFWTTCLPCSPASYHDFWNKSKAHNDIKFAKEVKMINDHVYWHITTLFTCDYWLTSIGTYWLTDMLTYGRKKVPRKHIVHHFIFSL